MKEKLIPFEVIEKAVAGESEAIDAVLRHYTTGIKYLSAYQGHINDNIQDRLKAQLMKAILQFRFDRQQVTKSKTAVKRAQSDRPLTLSIQYGMFCSRG